MQKEIFQSEIDISFIIPVYNTSEFLRKCIESIIHQYTNITYELIIINDGSSDNSLEIIKKYHDLNCIKILTQTNKGLSYTRNRGIKIASGKYIWFVDSDDYIENNSIMSFKDIIKHNYDIISFNTYKCFNLEKIKINKNLVPNKKSDKLLFFLKGYVYPYSGVQFYLFRRSFLEENNLLFIENTIHEDLLFTPLAIAKASSIYYTDIYAYNYLIREGSIVNSKMTKTRCQNFISIINNLIRESSKFKYFSKESVILRTAYSMAIGQLNKNFISKIKIDERAVLIKSIKSFKFGWIHILFSCKPYYLLRYFNLAYIALFNNKHID